MRSSFPSEMGFFIRWLADIGRYYRYVGVIEMRDSSPGLQPHESNSLTQACLVLLFLLLLSVGSRSWHTPLYSLLTILTFSEKNGYAKESSIHVCICICFTHILFHLNDIFVLGLILNFHTYHFECSVIYLLCITSTSEPQPCPYCILFCISIVCRVMWIWHCPSLVNTLSFSSLCVLYYCLRTALFTRCTVCTACYCMPCTVSKVFNS